MNLFDYINRNHAYFTHIYIFHLLVVSWIIMLLTNLEISYSDFLAKFKNVFDKGSIATTASHQLLNLKQGKRSVSDFSIHFWILVEETGQGQEAIKSTLLNNV